MSAIRYAALPGRVLIDTSDKTLDYLINKLVVTSNLTRTILNVGANEQIQLDINPSAAGGLDSRYIKRAPSTENESIIPATNNIPLTIKGFAGGSSKILDIFDSSTPTQFEKWYWDKNANLTMLFGNPVATGTQSLQTSDTSGNISTILFVNTVGALQFGGKSTDSPLGPLAGIGVQSWQFVGANIVFTNTAAGFGIAVNNIAKANNTPSAGTAWLLRNPLTEEIDIGTTGPIVLFGTKIDNTANLMQFLGLITEQLTADPGNTSGRLYERTDLKQISWMDGSAVHRLIDGSPSGVSQTIIPLTDNVPLTIKGFPGGVSDLLDIFDSTSPTQVVRWKWLTNAALQIFAPASTTNMWNLQVTGEATGRMVFQPAAIQFGPGTAAVDTIFQRSAGGILQITFGAGATNLAQLSLLGGEASAAERRIRENAGALEITDSTPTVLRSIITRGAPNVAVAHNAVSVAVSFSTSEPDTNYEITIVPAYNTTVWYTLKAITGFTANFGTAGPVGGSTFDWTIERIPRT